MSRVIGEAGKQRPGEQSALSGEDFGSNGRQRAYAEGRRGQGQRGNRRCQGVASLGSFSMTTIQ